MILIFGGTTEGRRALTTLDKAGKHFFYSTRSDLQKVDTFHGKIIAGEMKENDIKKFCIDNEIKLIVDAAHPFAIHLHNSIEHVSCSLNICVIRFERIYSKRNSRFIYCDDYEDAVKKLEDNKITNLLALTGVQTIPRLKPFWETHDCIFRILDRDESRKKAKSYGFPLEKTVYYYPEDRTSGLIEKYRPQAIITKESGKSGGFIEKTDAALKKGIKVFVISRPALSENFITVTGEFGLRKEIERLLPGFYDLRSGFTTGACATAAAKAALLALVEDDELSSVDITIPNGETLKLPIKETRVEKESAYSIVQKDGGDDPDVTDKALIRVDVKLTHNNCVRFFGGKGVGTITLPGIGLEPGEPAINPIPRKMMTNELLKIYPEGCDVTISVEGGEELAKKTFNPKIGIIGGISIIGTSGVVMPFSNKAFLESIRKEMEVGMAVGCRHIIINSGARSEKYVKSIYPNLHYSAFIHYGNAIGETLKIASSLKIENLTAGIMIGKAVKLAEGKMDTHSHKVIMNKEFLINIAKSVGCSNEALLLISNLNMAKELWSSLNKKDAEKFFPRLLELCYNHCRKLFPTGNLEMLLLTDSGELAYRIGKITNI